MNLRLIILIYQMLRLEIHFASFHWWLSFFFVREAIKVAFRVSQLDGQAFILWNAPLGGLAFVPGPPIIFHILCRKFYGQFTEFMMVNHVKDACSRARQKHAYLSIQILFPSEPAAYAWFCVYCIAVLIYLIPWSHCQNLCQIRISKRSATEIKDTYSLY